MILYLLLASLLSVTELQAKDFGPTLEARHPNLLLTSDYGIVTEDDLTYDEENGEPIAKPYDPSEITGQRRWQCVPRSNVKPHYHNWRGEDGMGYSGVEIDLCDLEIQVRLPSALHIYADRRGHPAQFCRSFQRKWKKLTRNQEIVCLEGEGGWNEEDNEVGKYRLWTWTKWKTKIGCYAYFPGECHVTGCAKGKCPK